MATIPDFDKLAGVHRAAFAEAAKAMRATGSPVKARTFEARADELIADWLRLAKAELDDQMALADPDALADALADALGGDRGDPADAADAADADPGDREPVNVAPVATVTELATGAPARAYASRGGVGRVRGV